MVYAAIAAIRVFKAASLISDLWVHQKKDGAMQDMPSTI
jgi:hypothetical protein